MGQAAKLLEISAADHAGAVAPHNNAHPSKPVTLDHGPFELPRGWVWTTIGSVLTHLVDCVNDTPNFAESDTGLVGLKSTNVRPYRLDLRRRWFMKQEDFASWNRREEPREGDIVLTREAPMGYACVIPSGVKVCLTQRLMLLRANLRTIDRSWLRHYLNSPLFHGQVEDRCRGLTTPHIRVQDVPKFAFPLAPLEEPRRIVGRLGELQGHLDGLKQLQTDTAAELSSLMPAILDRAFKGEL